MRSFAGRTVVITGAAGGIGRALVQAFAGEGARLALCDQDAAGLDALLSELSGCEVTTHVHDLRQVELLVRLAAEIERQHGAIDVLINNAGLTVHGRFADHTPEQLDELLDVDLRAALHLTHACLPALRRAAGRAPDEGPGAHIALVSSMAGVLAFPYQSVYSAAKHGLRGFGQALRMELGAERIGVTTVLPGTTATPFLAAAASHDTAMSAKMATLMQRFGTSPALVARAMIGALRADRGELAVGWDSRLTAALQRLAPPLLPRLLGAGFRWYAGRDASA
jgi:short-subunit dehydrogenase